MERKQISLQFCNFCLNLKIAEDIARLTISKQSRKVLLVVQSFVLIQLRDNNVKLNFI